MATNNTTNNGYVTIPTLTGAANINSSIYSTYTTGNSIGTFNIGAANFPPPILQFSNASGEIVRLTETGKVEWTNGIDIDEAADAFGKAIQIGAELKCGITQRVKCEMRDSIFADIISLAKTKGALTADDLTFMLESSKIIEKLSGNK